MNLIEQLEKLPTYDVDEEGEILREKGGYYIHYDDIRAIIAQAKTEQRRIDACLKACDGISTENLEDNDPLLSVVRKYNELLKQKSTPQPDHTKREAVEHVAKLPQGLVSDLLVAADLVRNRAVATRLSRYAVQLLQNQKHNKQREAIK